MTLKFVELRKFGCALVYARVSARARAESLNSREHARTLVYMRASLLLLNDLLNDALNIIFIDAAAVARD